MTAPLNVQYLEQVSHHPDGIEIDFARIPTIQIAAKNINQCTLSGPVGPTHDFNRCNIISSTLDGIQARKAAFPSVDFKDCLIIDSEFTKTGFNGLAFVNNTVTRTHFEACHFNDTSMTDCEFVETLFSGCDFTNLLIKGCRFVRCGFVGCVTSNKLFETCLVLDCRFERTELQVQTITSNFGISADQLRASPIRSHDPKVVFEYVDASALEEIATAQTGLAPVERLRVAYFLAPDVLWGSEVLDAALDARGWLQLCRVPSTFAIILQDFSEFLLWEYDQDRLMVHPLLLLQTLTSQLSTHFGGDASANPRVSRAIMGVHMQLSHTVEEFLGVLSGLALHAGDQVRFVADGPLDPEYYHRELAHVFAVGDVRLVDVKPHNSPIELVFEWLSQPGLYGLLAAFAASRVKVQLRHLGASLPVPPEGAAQEPTAHEQDVQEEEVQQADVEEKGIAKPVARGRSKGSPAPQPVGGSSGQSVEVFSYNMGFMSGRSRAYQLKARALLPGSLLLDLRLEIHTGILRRFHRTLLELLSPRKIAN